MSAYSEFEQMLAIVDAWPDCPADDEDKLCIIVRAAREARRSLAIRRAIFIVLFEHPMALVVRPIAWMLLNSVNNDVKARWRVCACSTDNSTGTQKSCAVTTR